MKKAMKYFWLLVVAAVMFSCQKETGDTPGQQPANDTEEQAGDPAGPEIYDLDPEVYLTGFSADLEHIDSKVSVDLSTNALSFENGDAVLVVTASKSGKYVYNATDEVFEPEDTDQAVPVGSAKAYYPYSEFAAEGETVTFTMPDAVAAGSAEDLGDKMPMAALISADGVAQFKNLGSILRVRFNSAYTDGETITRVELSGSGVNITGSGIVSWDGEIPGIASLSGSSSISIGVTDGHLTGGAYKEFYFFLPSAGSFADMTIKAVYGKEGGYEPYETIKRNGAMSLARNKMLLVSKPLSGFFSGGDGSVDHPYLISTADNFKAIASLANADAATENENHGNGYLASASRTFFGSPSVHYRQTADLDFSNATIPSIGVYTARPFRGTYDGDSKKLKNFKVTGTLDGSAGLFEYVSGGHLKNIQLVHAQIVAPNTAGVLTGRCIGATKIEGCSLDGGQLTGRNSVGFIAHLSGTDNIEVKNCSVKNFTIITAASGSSDANNQGGIVGWAGNGNASILNCSTSGDIQFTGTPSGTARGGIIGKFDSTGEVRDCTNGAGINNQLVNSTGGIVGLLTKGTVVECINTGSVTGEGNVGGIVGLMSSASSTFVHVEKCRVNASVSGTGNCVGGIVGCTQNGVINTCFAKGDVSCAGYDVGGIVGQVYANGTNAAYNRPYVYDCMANNDVTCTRDAGAANLGGVVGRIVRHSSYTGQYTAVDNCIGLNRKLKADSGTPYVGAFVGYVNANSNSNAGNVRVRNCISLVEDSNYNVTTSNANTGGFVGNYKGQLTHCYYLVSDNNQTAASGTPAASNLTKSDLATLTGAAFCTAHSSRATGYMLNVNSVQYKSSGWTYYSAGPYPVPTTLYNLGEDYYQ